MEFAFQLGEKQQPRLDKLLLDVARRLIFNKTNTKLIAIGMDGTVVEWDIQNRQKRRVSHIHAKRWFAYSTGMNQLLVREANDNITILSVGSGDGTLLTNGQYESGNLSADGTLAVLSKGNNEVEVWQLAKHSPKPMKGKGSVQKLKTLQTSFPVRNGLTLSDDGRFIAAAEGSYREGEGHRTVIEIWETYPTGIQSLAFSPNGAYLAVALWDATIQILHWGNQQ